MVADTKSAAILEETQPLLNAVITHCAFASLSKAYSGNSSPESQEDAELRDLMSFCADSLDILDRHVHNATYGLEALQQTRADIATAYEQCKVLTHPFRKLPAELLREVFLALSDVKDSEGLHSPADEQHGTTLHPWNVAEVCHSWREIAISTPRLWTKFSFNLNYMRPVAAQEEWAAITNLQLCRCLKYDIDMALSAASESVLGNCAELILPLILETAPRWRSLAITLPRFELAFLAPIAGRLPNLQKLSINIPSTLSEMGGDTDPYTLFESAPKLRHIVLDKKKEIAELLVLPWDQIMTFEDVGPRRPSHHLAVLRIAPNLEHFSITGDTIAEDRSNPNNPAFAMQPVRTLSLQSLTVGALTFDLERILAQLEMPALRSLTILGAPDLVPFQDMLQRSQCTLTHIGILAPRGYLEQPDKMANFLRPHTHIESLTVHEPCPEPEGLNEISLDILGSLAYPPKAPAKRSRRAKEKWESDEETDCEFTAKDEARRAEAMKPLLPCLKTIQASAPNLVLKDAFEAIESRLELPADAGVVSLQHLIISSQWEWDEAETLERLRLKGLLITT
ncbi:hypothetical protein BDZ89DRAFT_1155888 [Hymenopellis radicata]|nr:hypothetical protein BDZ89DRAFT_1155888 [Hymenopellis radicata]